MKRYGRIRISALVIWVLSQLMIPSNLQAQTFSYLTYDITNGLPGNYLNAIGQDNEGFLWLGLETGLYRYDGFEFSKVDLPDTLTTGYPATLFCDAGGRMWIGYTDGSLFKWEKGSGLLRQADVVADKINKIIPSPDGSAWIITQTSGVYVSGKEENGKIRKLGTPEGLIVFDIAFISNDSVLIATQDNLHICRIQEDQLVTMGSFTALDYTWIQSVIALPGRRWVAGTDGAGIYMITKPNGYFDATLIDGTNVPYDVRVPQIITGSGNNIIVASRESGVMDITFDDNNTSVRSVTSYNISSGLPDNDVKTVFRDREGNLWIGLFNKGLAAVRTNAFSFFEPGNDKDVNFIGESNGKVIVGTRNGLYDFNPLTNTFSGFRDIGKKTGGSGVTSWAADNDGNIWIGTVDEGLFVMDKRGSVRSFFRSANPAQNHINGITLESDAVWLATLSGVLIVDRNTRQKIGEYTTWNKLPHNNISGLVRSESGEMLVATETDRICYINIDGGVRNEGQIMEGTMGRNKVQAISVNRKDSSICVGTLGNGLFISKGDTLFNYTTGEGLLANYCYSTLVASDGRIWTGHEKGFSVINVSAGVVRTFGTDFGVRGDCLPNAIYEASDGRIYIGTTEGIIVYNPMLDQKNPAPPQAGFVKIVINGVEHAYQQTISLPYRPSYTIEIKYAGILLRDPLNVMFRTKLENFDEDWSGYSDDRNITYKLRDGHYSFLVEASARDNAALNSVASFSLVIQKPFFRSFWFISLMVLLAGGIVYIIILLRERAHRLQREYLEEELRKRTAQVHEQKEELFQKNLDITESIKYARRIQTSVLPDVAKLKNVFNDSFVFFLPRDIVSGDFYWFDWVDKNKFIVVCADSTGHGVPGAFMSMIGTALLQDIITRKKIVKPSEILHELDRRIFSTLNQNQEIEAANDGMDIIVCEFNVSTRHLTFASAMRPVILIIDGEQQYVRGNRSAVGGESVVEKFYDDQEYHLRQGDTVYLFSDGYPDQFGGHGSKKMKISRLRNLIEEIKSLPLKDQHARLRDYFFEWKGENEQVDDVLIMGIKV